MTLYFLCLCKEKKTFGRFQLGAPRAYKCKQILGLCQRLEGNGDVHNKIENCVRRLLSHDVDGTVEGSIDIKVDQFWDELNHFQNR